MGVCVVCYDAPRTGPCAACGRMPVPDLGRGGSVETARGGAAGGSSVSTAYGGGGVDFGDDPFADDATGGALELDAPPRVSLTTQAAPEAIPSHAPPPSSQRLPNAPPSAPAFSDPPASSEAAPPSRAIPHPALPPRDPAAMIARYPEPPSKIWEAPIYAARVLWRQFELQQDLTSLRRRRSPDVGLYERALKTHDAKTFALGLVLGGAAFIVASLIFFLPVILRFVHSPD